MHAELRELGQSGVYVSRLGFGARHLGEQPIADGEAARLLHAVLDLGCNFIDTALAFGRSQELVGRFLESRREEVILATKVGVLPDGIPELDGIPDWTYDAVMAGLEVSLHRLRTDYIDVAYIQGCPADILLRGYVIDALEHARQQGKVRAIGFAGDNQHLECAIASDRFDCVQTTLNIADQRSLQGPLPLAKATGLGVVAKHPIANAAWQHGERPAGPLCVTAFWERLQTMNLDLGMDHLEVALRFAVWNHYVDSACVGTINIAHLTRNVHILDRGPLPSEIYQRVRATFQRHDDGWVGIG